MRTYMVVVFDGDLPEEIGRSAYETFVGIASAWNALTGEPGIESFIEFLGPDAENEFRRRRSVIERLYANEPTKDDLDA